MQPISAFFDADDEPEVYEILALLDGCGYAGRMATTRSTGKSATAKVAKRKPAASAKSTKAAPRAAKK